MILFVSGRTDIVAFYSEWFMNRYREGFVDVRNPFRYHFVNRIYFKDVDAILFCTKNPGPIVDKLERIDKPIMFHVTITPYLGDIEPCVKNKGQIIADVKKISQILGSDNVVVRYDPIFINDVYTVGYHIRAFSKLCEKLNGYVGTIIVSFIDDYKNVRKNADILRIKPLTENDLRELAVSFSSVAAKYDITVQTCAEERKLLEYGFSSGECMSPDLAFKLTNKKFKRWKSRNNNNCNCVEMVDIGVYNTCSHLCKYCYANFDEEKVKILKGKHDPMSTMLIGHLDNDDEIKIRK